MKIQLPDKVLYKGEDKLKIWDNKINKWLDKKEVTNRRILFGGLLILFVQFIK